MRQKTGSTSRERTATQTDLAAAVQRVLAASEEPLTPSKIRARLGGLLRTGGGQQLVEVLSRQVAAHVLCLYPRYRSRQDRYWDRSMPVHVAALLRQAMEDRPLAWPELRRKLPAYARTQAEAVLLDQVAQGLMHRHPPMGKRRRVLFGLHPPDAKDYLRSELERLFSALEQLGFSQSQLRAGALELLHEEEWASRPPDA